MSADTYKKADNRPYARKADTSEDHLRRRYRIGQKEFEELLAEQGGACAICRTPDPEHVDHDHVFGNVRGILCFNCNGGLASSRTTSSDCARRSVT